MCNFRRDSRKFPSSLSLLITFGAKSDFTRALTAPVSDDAHALQRTIFDPIPRADGIEPSADPLLEVRADVYLMSGRRRRAAPEL